MTLSATLKKRLAKTLAEAKNLETSTRRLVKQIEISGDNVNSLEGHFVDFSEHLINFFQEVRVMAASSQEARALLETSVTDKLAELAMLMEIDAVDYINIARHIDAAAGQDVMDKAVRELLSKEGGLEKAEWLYNALMRLRPQGDKDGVT